MATESLMNAAGRSSSHPFADLRSASHAHHRTQTYPYKRTPPKYKYSRSRREPVHEARIIRKQDAYIHIASRPWEDDFTAQADHEFAVYYSDDMVLNQRYGKFAELVDRKYGRVGSVRLGEGFGEWVMRRVGEMRGVKEERLGRKIAGGESLSGVMRTTRPTDPDDILGHALLRDVLDPLCYPYCLRPRYKPFFPIIDAVLFFGAATWDWQWHRNASGCWELGYVSETCEGGAFPCSCCGQGNGDMFFDCSCKEFGVGELWELAAPEDMQRCCLAEWIKGPGLDGLVEEIRETEEEGDERASEAWEVLSDAASQGWSIVSDVSEFEMV